MLCIRRKPFDFAQESIAGHEHKAPNAPTFKAIHSLTGSERMALFRHEFAMPTWQRYFFFHTPRRINCCLRPGKGYPI